MTNINYSSFKSKHPNEFIEIVNIYQSKSNNLEECIKQLEDKKKKTKKM